MPLTLHEIKTLLIIERFTASVSVIGTLVLITTFIFIKELRTLSNTLIFYASFANLFANVAALIGRSALNHEALCQFQGFLLEMFMQSDPMWSCAMAFNVYLVFFRRYDARRLRDLYWIYAVICYGLPFIPAMFCLLYKEEKKGRMYGNATLWCWIKAEYAPVRIYSYYAPIWIAILIALLIYIRVGIDIFQKRSQLHAADSQHCTRTDPLHPAAISGTRTTEIQVTTDLWNGPSSSAKIQPASPAKFAHSRNDSITRIEPIDQYSITICAHNPRNGSMPTLARTTTFSKRPTQIDKIKWAYMKCALLFAASILITWVPASINRLHDLRYPGRPSYALNIGSAFVLPLQGFWNTVIYFTTSLGICRNVWRRWRARRVDDGCENLVTGRLDGKTGAGGKTEVDKGLGNDSNIELSQSRSMKSLADSF